MQITELSGNIAASLGRNKETEFIKRKKGKKKRKGFQIEKRVSSICTVLVLKIRLIDECALRSGLKHIEIEKGGLKF